MMGVPGRPPLRPSRSLHQGPRSRPPETRLCPRPASSSSPRGRWPVAGALIGCGASEAGARSADWSARLGGARDPASRWGKRAETGAAGARGADPSGRAGRSDPHLGAGPAGKGAALGRVGGPLCAESRWSPSALPPREQNPTSPLLSTALILPRRGGPLPRRRRSPPSREQIASFSRQRGAPPRDPLGSLIHPLDAMCPPKVGPASPGT